MDTSDAPVSNTKYKGNLLIDYFTLQTPFSFENGISTLRSSYIALSASVIANEPDDAGNYYDAACLYSRMGEFEKSIKFLQTALEKGYRRFAHIEMDDDLNGIRELPEFEALILQYKKIFESEIEETDAAYLHY
ncbi:hypothetical protein SAMN05444001_1247 [Parabacteroides chinchillae]|uniref:Tetratricopeptide repeat-containing protein n=2 Tax=Parabacteroides chinchillae TaxID=871327 RepID=A0A8G2BYW4_9BACT|nr:hypothetical protein SAMN05444001_1247 [Parabacteroides chinchillae]